MSGSTIVETPDPRIRSFFERYHVFQLTIAAIIVAAHFPLLHHHFHRLWSSNHYRYYPIVLAAVGYLLGTRWIVADVRRSTLNRQVLSWLAAGFGLLVLSVLYWWSWSAMVGLICTCRAMQLSFEDKQQNKASTSLSIWLLLWLLVSIPLTWDIELIYQLQNYSSLAASFVLDFLGINHLLLGHVVESTEQRFLVDEACSGVRSLFAIFACTAIFVVFAQRSFVHSILLLMAAAFWTMIVNILRITIVVVSGISLGIDISYGWRHEVLGLVLFGLALLMLFSTDRLLLFLLSPAPKRRQNPYFNPCAGYPYVGNPYLKNPYLNNPYLASSATNASEPAVDQLREVEPSEQQSLRRSSFWPIAVWCTVAVAFGCIGLAQFVLSSHSETSFEVVSFEQDLLPQRDSGFVCEDFEHFTRDGSSYYGKYSDTWTYRCPAGLASVSCDYPFFDWHSLTKCYRGSGWRLQEPTAVSLDQQGEAIDFAETMTVSLRGPQGERAYLLYSIYRSDGRPVRPPGAEGRSLSWLWTEIRRNLVEHFAVRFGTDRLAYQFQILVAGGECDSPEIRKKVEEFYTESRRKMLQKLTRDSIGATNL